MRYAHMVRQHHSTLPPPPTTNTPRKFRPITKRANTFALDIRHALTSTRIPYIVIILLSLPFLTGIVNLLTRSAASKSSTTLAENNANQSRVVTASPSLISTQSNQLGHLRPGGEAHTEVALPPSKPKPINVANYLNKLSTRRKQSNLTATSVTLIASCQGVHESLAMSFPSWSAQQGVDHIVLVDSSNSSSLEWHKIPHFSEMVQSGRLTVILRDTSKWAMSRAYNLAAEFAIGEYILKVDCDTYLHSDFLSKHPLPTNASYYTVSWGSPRTVNEEPLRGVWFGRLSDFRKVGGYDERIVRYGFEDTDLYNRFNNRASLSPKSLNLDTLHHNVAPALLYHQLDDFLISRHMSIRVHEALINSLPIWPDVHEGLNTKYTFAYDEASKMILANETRAAPDPYIEKSDEGRQKLLTPVLQAGLHDDFNIPWDIIPSFGYEDLLFLARYLDDDSEPHVIVALLEGTDSLSNVFNLVSVLQLAMTVGRPMIVIWNAPGAATVADSSTPLLRELFDMLATNEQLVNAAKSDAMRSTRSKDISEEHVRLIAADKWKCVEGLETCGEKYDKAYSSFSEVAMHMSHVYDEVEPLPIAISKHTLLRLKELIKIGNMETRMLAYKSIVQASIVREAQQRFVAPAKLGIVAESEDEVENVAHQVRQKFPDVVAEGLKQLIPVVGPGALGLKKNLFGDASVKEFCYAAECSMKQVAMDVANVLAMCEVEEIFPKKTIESGRTIWTERSDVSYMMATDLWSSHRG